MATPRPGLFGGLHNGHGLAKERDKQPYRIDRSVATHFFDGKRCWCHARAGIVPGAGQSDLPRVVMTMNSLDVSGSDVFRFMAELHSDDFGKTWSDPQEVDALALRREDIDGEELPVGVCDFWPTWHRTTQKLLGTGHTVVYTKDWKVKRPRPRHTSYSVYEPQNQRWSRWRKLQLPDQPMYQDAGAGCSQRFDLDDGTILLPFYFRPPHLNSRVTVSQCEFDGTDLSFVKHGNVMQIDNETRGLHEPSLTRFNDVFYLTLRNDEQGYVTRGDNGIDFEPIRSWRFDDGELLGNYNTQQHWVTHSDALYLVYTRRGADNDHVFRHRAPLFMAQVDPERMCVLRDTEQVLVEERGARLGNFGVTHVSPHETWVTVAEWMQTKGPKRVLDVDNPYGSDGSVWVARIQWDQPNQLFTA